MCIYENTEVARSDLLSQYAFLLKLTRLFDHITVDLKFVVCIFSSLLHEMHYHTFFP